MVRIEDLNSDAQKNVAGQLTLKQICYNGAVGRSRTRVLYDMFYAHGPGNGTMLSLPFDQLIEHGPGHLLKEEKTADPREVIKLANKGGFSALALSIGQAEKYQMLINPDVPLIVKVDGHFLVGKDVPYDRHSTFSSIERALKAGADAIGATFYLGGKETEQDAERCSRIIEETHKNNKPVFLWAYARGPLPEAMGADSLFWCAYGVSAAESLGADVVKQKFPMPAKNSAVYRQNLTKFAEGEKEVKGYFYASSPEAEKLLALEPKEGEVLDYETNVKRLNFLARTAPSTPIIVSGGPKVTNSEHELRETTKIVMDSGCVGRIVGRNLWGVPLEEGIKLAELLKSIMREPKYFRAW